ncbi:MAG: hypothetical protein HYU37_00950 [Acidobacteria bacterium]|nr:hypothetical protein [Acidobacteriota bacterium]
MSREVARLLAVIDAAYWKYAALRRLTLRQAQGHPERSRAVTGGRRGSFPLKGSNWFARGDASDERAWRDDVALLHRMHRSLRDAVARLSAADLDCIPAGSTVSAFALLSGVAAHDLYHAGQIQLLKRLQQRT